MTEPIFDPATERLYSRLPQHYRTEDRNHDWQFKRFISGIANQLSLIDEMARRFMYTSPEDIRPDATHINPTSDLVDPLTADASWLPWLAQLVGIRFNVTTQVSERRARVNNVNFYKGTKAYIAAAAQSVLTGDKFVAVYDHATSSLDIGSASQWDVLLITVASETISDPVEAVIKLGAKPAGIELHHESFSSTWAEIHAALPTWAHWNATTWLGMAESGL